MSDQVDSHLCDYGCGSVANFFNKSEKWCCSVSDIPPPGSARLVSSSGYVD